MSNVEKAVSFAASMIRNGDYFGRAVSVAAGYYKVSASEVRSGLASRSGKSQAGKKKTRYQWTGKERCADCDEPAVWRGVIRHCYAKAGTVFMCERCGKNLPCWYEGAPDSVTWHRKPEPKEAHE